MAETKRKIRCRVLNRTSDPCSGEAVDPTAELLICPRHLAMAMRLLNEARVKVGAPK